MNKEEMLKVVDENITKLKNKEYTLYFFVLDTKGNPSHSLEYIYHTALTLMKRGHKVAMLHQEQDFIGVKEWLGEEYANIPHMNIETENVEISPSDFIFIPEIFANVMMQTKNLPCKRVVLVQNYANISEFMPISHTLDTLGIVDVIATSKFHEERVRRYFPGIRTHIVSPSVKPVFRANNDIPRDLIINLVVREQSDANLIVKPFYWKHPVYRWVSFRDLRNLPKETMAEALRTGAITIWADDKTDFGTGLLEIVKCGGVVLAKVPENIQDWMMDGDELTKSILWFNSIEELSDILPSVVRSWSTDTIPTEVYESQKELYDMFTEDIQKMEIIETYEKNIIARRLADFEEAKADIKNKNK